MKLGETIRTHRKVQNLTQEEMARRLGVTASAVNKWENGNTCPDITLLAPIARLLHITLDRLLSFQEELTKEEINDLVKTMDAKLQVESYGAVFQWAQEILRTYPNCMWLIWQFAVILDGNRLSQEAEPVYDEGILSWYTQALESGEEDLRYHAADSLFSWYLRKGDYEKAETYLAYYSKENPERKRKQGDIARKLGRREEAYRTYEELLFAGYQTAYAVLWELYGMAVEDGNWEMAEMLMEKEAALAALFEMGAYHQASAGLELAALERDTEKTLDMMETMLDKLETISGFRASPLYRHMHFKDPDPQFLERQKTSLKDAFRDKEIYGFLQGEPRWERLTRRAEAQKLGLYDRQGQRPVPQPV